MGHNRIAHLITTRRGSRNFRQGVQLSENFDKQKKKKKKKKKGGGGGEKTEEKEGLWCFFPCAEICFKSAFQTIIYIQVYFR